MAALFRFARDAFLFAPVSSSTNFLMATSSSDESCSAPTDFDISSLLDESNGKFSLSWEHCPLCKKSKRSYYCKDCIRNGDFVHSTFSRNPERFSEKKVRLFQIARDRLHDLGQVNQAFEPIAKVDKLKGEIDACREKIELLKLAIKDAQEFTSQAKCEIQRNEEYIQKRRVTNTLYLQKIQKMQRHKNAVMNNFTERLGQLTVCRNELKKIMSENINQLVQLIFPITRVCVDERNNDSFTEDTINALAEATRTAYVKGRWIYTDNTGDIQFKIVESLLPGNGDYSVYSAWVHFVTFQVMSNKESVPAASSELCHRSSACAISASLTYLCQFVSIAASLLDVYLPKRLCYSEFCSHELSKQDFAYKVAKLNANVIHLCLSQNVNPDHLHPRHTAANLVLLLDPKMCDLGRCGAFEVNAEVMMSMEESLMQDLDVPPGCEDDDWQEDMDILGEWETIPEACVVPKLVTRSAMPNVAHQRITRQNTVPSDAATSVAGGFMSAAASVVSLWKAAIGHR